MRHKPLRSEFVNTSGVPSFGSHTHTPEPTSDHTASLTSYRPKLYRNSSGTNEPNHPEGHLDMGGERQDNIKYVNTVVRGRYVDRGGGETGWGAEIGEEPRYVREEVSEEEEEGNNEK